ncbi:hypothetical protein [Bradyrhizobium pachyrhizi]|uniref:hypothetical protein n=1 Tax=Bradyrhizobium pachyrhizi TaxID=280333 RepID=UPI003D364903
MEHSKTQLNKPMTIGHGKRLYEQAKHMSTQLEELKLALLEPADSTTSRDPIAEITALLRNLTVQGQHQLAEMQTISAKLNAVLRALGIGEL